MDGESRSDQERLVRKLAEDALAAPFVFKPLEREWKKGREPPDLVWACNNCVILMWETKNKDYADPEENQKVCQKAIRHNLKQAGGVLRLWRQGAFDLVGENSHSKFRLKYSPNVRVVILSIIECGEAIAQLHLEEAQQFGVTCCATLPYSVVARLVGMHGSAIDLILFLAHLKDGYLPEMAALFSLERYAVASWEQSGANAIWPGGNLDKRYWDIAGLLLQRRRSPLLPSRKDSVVCSLDDLNEALNDITAAGFLSIVVEVRRLIESIESMPDEDNPPSICRASISPYDFVACVFRERNDKNAPLFDLASTMWQDLMAPAVGLLKPGVFFRINLATRTAEVYDLEKIRDGPSNLERALDQFK